MFTRIIKLKRVKILDFFISGCILHTKISRMVIFGLDFLLYFLKLYVGNGFYHIQYSKQLSKVVKS